MLSFYGGQNGQSFVVKKVFANCKALVADLTDVNSPVEIDEYATVFYGKLGDPNYQTNFDADNPSEEEITDNKAVKYGNRNASFWKKVYKLEDELNKLDESEKSKYLSDTNTNVRYYNLGYFSANTTMVTVNSTTGIAPMSEPKVSVNKDSTPDQCLLDFEIPKAAKIYQIPYYKSSTSNSSDKKWRVLINTADFVNKYTIDELYPKKGNYYFDDEYNTLSVITADGYPDIEYSDCFILTLELMGQLNGPINNTVLVEKASTTYKDNNQTLSDGSAEFVITKHKSLDRIENQQLKITIPQIPKIEATAVTDTSLSNPSVSTRVKDDKNGLVFDFKLPLGPQGLVGPVGPGFDIIDMIEVTGTSDNINDTIVTKLNQLYSTKPESTQIIGVNYIDSSTGNAIASYWYCWTQNAWHCINAFGGSSLSWKEL